MIRPTIVKSLFFLSVLVVTLLVFLLLPATASGDPPWNQGIWPINMVNCDGGVGCSVSTDPVTGHTALYIWSDGGVSSVTGSSGVSCSPTTGAVSCTNTGVLTIAGGTNITCSPTSGSAVCSFTGVLPTPLGGTAVASPTAHEVAVAEGTSPFNFVGPGSSGQPLLSGGSGADPAYGTLGPTGGGTGINALCSGGQWPQSNGLQYLCQPAIVGSMLGYNANSVSALSGTSFVTIASFTATTPADGITHAYRLHADFNFALSTPAASSWIALCGISQNSTTVALSPTIQQMLYEIPDVGGVENASNTVTTTAPPNTSETFRAMCELNTSGGTGIAVNANLDAVIAD